MNEKHNTLYQKKKPLAARRIAQYISDKIIAEEKKASSAQTNFQKYGNSKEYIELGKKERLSVMTDFSIKERTLEDITKLKQGEVLAYHYGYTEAANRLLIIGINDNNFTEEQLCHIGYVDSLDQNIEFEELPSTIKENKDYLIGYKKGLEELKTKNKHR